MPNPLILGLVAAGTFSLLKRRHNGFKSFPIDSLVDPEIVSDLAQRMDAAGPDEFLMEAWDYVGRTLPYEPVSSQLTFVNGSIVECESCYLPSETLVRGKGNCVAKSALLASLLRNRFPPEDVVIGVGDLILDDVGGHAWVELWRNGEWNIIESTKPAGNMVSADGQRGIYVPYAFINDRTINCMDGRMCLSIPAHHASCFCENNFRY